jgi:hypothetical protein
MQLYRVVPVLAIVAVLGGCAGGGVRPTKENPPYQAQFDRCYTTAKSLGNMALQGMMTIKMVVDVDGTVPAAYISDVKGLDSMALNRCVMNFIVNVKWPAEGLDYLRPYSVSYAGVASFLPDPKDIPKDVPLDEKLAQDTLEFADWATAVDKGWGLFYVHKYADAIASFKAYLAQHPDDVRALRGLAAAQAVSGGDLKEARQSAAKAIQLKPDTEATHEAMLRVCIAEKNDECIFDEFDKARKASDVNIRSIELATLQDAAKAAADRLQSSEHTRHEQEVADAKKKNEEMQKKNDPLGCGKVPEGDERTLCFVKGCFDKGGHTYAESLRGLTGASYKAGEWKIASKGTSSKVTLTIRASGVQAHDASWQVTVGDNVDMRPLDIDANNISTQYNACRK